MDFDQENCGTYILPGMEQRMKEEGELHSTFTIRSQNSNMDESEKLCSSGEFVEMRRQALDAFVNRITCHHELHLNEDLKLFLQAEKEGLLGKYCNYKVLL